MNSSEIIKEIYSYQNLSQSELADVENHIIRTNESVTLYHGSKSGICGAIAMAEEICRKYRRDGRFFDEILKAGESYEKSYS